MSTSKKRLLIATGLYPPEVGGPATYSKMLYDELPERSFSVDILPFSSVRHLPKVARHLAYTRALLARAASADLIYAQDTVSVGLPAAIAAFISRKPLMVRVPGDYAWEQSVQRFGITDSLDEFQKRAYGAKVEMLRRVQRFVVRRARVVVVPSRYLQRIAMGWGVPEERIQVIYSSIELPVETQASKTRPEGFLIVSAGRLVPWKGMRELIEIAALNRDWNVAIVGDGPERRALEHAAQEYDVSERVLFTGMLSRAQALGWAKTANVFVLNSSYEGLSHMLVEVMSLGTPVVATNAGGNPELVENGVSGLLIPVGDKNALDAAIREVAIHPDKAGERASEAQKRLHAFTAETTLQQLMELLQKICES